MGNIAVIKAISYSNIHIKYRKLIENFHQVYYWTRQIGHFFKIAPKTLAPIIDNQISLVTIATEKLLQVYKNILRI